MNQTRHRERALRQLDAFADLGEPVPPVDVVATHDGERRLTLGVGRKTLDFDLPIPINRGVYADDRAYVRGDCVTHSGCLWIARGPASGCMPGVSSEWRLAVVKGRNWRDADHRRGARTKT